MDYIEAETMLDQLEEMKRALIDAKATDDHENFLLNEVYMHIAKATQRLRSYIHCEG